MKTNLKIVAISILASILLVPVLQTKVFADEPKLDTDSVNEVSLQAVFHFREGIETVNTFKVFDTMSSGFDKTKLLTFKLEGVIGWDKPLLYKAVDMTYQWGRNQNHDYSEFDVDVIFQRGEQPYRQFTYSDCQIKNYNVYTEYDKEETYNAKTDFVYLDKIEFDCRGFSLVNPTYDKMLQDQVAEKTAEARANLNHEKGIEKSTESIKAEYVMQGKLITQDFSVDKVPSWVEQNAQWLSEGKITSQEYQNLLHYLVSKGVL